MVAPRLYYTIKEAAQVLGLSVATVRRRIDDGTLPVFQPGGEGTAVRVPVDALKCATDTKSPAIESSPHDAKPKPRRKGPQPKWQAILDDPNQN